MEYNSYTANYNLLQFNLRGACFSQHAEYNVTGNVPATEYRDLILLANNGNRDIYLRKINFQIFGADNSCFCKLVRINDLAELASSTEQFTFGSCSQNDVNYPSQSVIHREPVPVTTFTLGKVVQQFGIVGTQLQNILFDQTKVVKPGSGLLLQFRGLAQSETLLFGFDIIEFQDFDP